MKGLPELGENEKLLPWEIHITPSNINPWRGQRREADRYTMEQHWRMKQAGIDPDTVEDVIVRDRTSWREWWSGGAQPVYVMPCPILERRPNGELLVLSPAGDRKIVQADGTKGRRRRGFGGRPARG